MLLLQTTSLTRKEIQQLITHIRGMYQKGTRSAYRKKDFPFHGNDKVKIFYDDICDWASKIGPSGHINFDYIHFPTLLHHNLGFNYTTALKLIHKMYNLISNILKLQNTNTPYRSQDIYYFMTRCSLCPLVHFCGLVTFWKPHVMMLNMMCSHSKAM